METQAQLTGLAASYFEQQFDVDWNSLLAPLDGPAPTGRSLRGNGVYSEIKLARRHDDPTLPLGPWVHELKKADWDRVSEVAVAALAHKTKDLQLAAWLLEAQISKHGFAGIAPCVELMRELCERYWTDLHPSLAEEEGLEYRGNIVCWIDEHLLPLLRQVPLTNVARGREYCWADWEQARRDEQVRALHGRPEGASEAVPLAELAGALAATGTPFHGTQLRLLRTALAAIEAFNETFDRLYGDEAPRLAALGELLERIDQLLSAELLKRGVAVVPTQWAAAGDRSGDGGAPPSTDNSDGANGDGGGRSPIRDRASAYAALAQASDFLMHVEPHSPAPYLVKRAIAWGQLNTAELYHELFVKFGGQLNIFEMLGLRTESDTEKTNEHK